MKKKYIILLIVCLCFLIAINGVSASNFTNVGVDVNYQYAGDAINPTFNIINDQGSLQFIKEFDSGSGEYKLILNKSQISPSSSYNISVSAPGYITQVQIIKFNNVSSPVLSNLVFNMKATDNYIYGKEITKVADARLDLKNADDVLVVTTAGVPKIDGKTSEDVINGILSQTYGKVSYGLGNILMLRQTATDPIDSAFIVKKGNSLTAVIFLKGSTSASYFGTISDKMSRSEWNILVNTVGGENAFAFASLANGWVSGVSKDVLQEAAFHGHICDGTLGGYTIVQTLLTYYPPLQETQGGSGSPGDITSYKIIGVPGDSDDDAVLFFLDATPGKSGYIGFDTTATGATKDMIAFIRWQDSVVKYDATTNSYKVTKPGKGTLILMSFNSTKNKEQFKKETGVDPNAGSLEELRYQDWWINKIYTNPASLVDILYELDNLNEEQYYYFIGVASNITYPKAIKNATNAGAVRIAASEAHGLDYAYIKSLAEILPTATRANVTMGNGNLNYDQIKEIGLNASKMAKQYFKDELNIIIEKDNPNFAIFTSAGYVYLNGQTTEAVRDGIAEVFGSTLFRKTLLPIHVGVWKPLWFAFVLRDNGKLLSVFIRYNPDGTYFVGEVDGAKVNDIGINALNNSTTVKKLSSTFITDHWFGIHSIANAWNSNPEFDQLITFLFHDHACPGVQPGFFITDYIKSNYPLNENESYNYVASSIYCKDDSLVYLLGISPGMESYFNQRLLDEETESSYVDGATEEGVLIIWDNKLNIGRAVIINFKWATIDTSKYSTSEARRAAQINAYIDMYANRPNSNVKEGVTVKATAERWITQEQFQMLKSGSGDSNALRYLESIPYLSKQALLDQMKKNEDNNQNNGTYVNNGGQSSNNGVSSSDSSNYGYDSVGLGASNIDLASSSDSDGNSGDSSKGKSYEVSKSIASGNNKNNFVYAILLVIIIAIIGGYGFMRYRNKL